MLISAECLYQIDQEVQKIVQRVSKVLNDPEEGLEAIFTIGKLATLVSSDAPLRMSRAKALDQARRYGIVLGKEDKAVLSVLRKSTDAWLAQVQDDLNKRVRQALVVAEEDYLNQVMRRKASGELKKSLWSDLKEFALGILSFQIGSVLNYFEHTLDRFLQTELAKYFQKGQVQDVTWEEEVYKIPRLQACPHCMRLHLNPDGSPRVYKLKEVHDNSNIGLKASEWKFTVGPVHPHCYCILYRVTKRPAPGPSEIMSTARQESLAVGLQKRKDILAQAKARYEEAQKLADN